ncbi:MAG: hypothetical protein A3E84_00840 [Gammaproteobacteria bacterium RIFCSPHIGHO2_12_FULL_42_13]|nr:MAG: hypothetical protein A3E84_00840 [Gammaproteobacteria bacterium RIFCSPHIGHO2_12_FULL_42_13]
MVVLDTCALIDACDVNPTMSKKTLKLIESGAFILSVSFAEIACKVKLKKLHMLTTPKLLFSEFSQIKNVAIIDIGVDEWLDSIELDWPDNKDPADRIITAFAIKKSIPIVSTDQKIKSFYKKVIW